MDMGYIIAFIARIFALMSVALFVYYMYSLFKKAGSSKNKVIYRILTVIFSGFVLAITLFPFYYILPGKTDVSAFNNIVEYTKDNKSDYYYFQTKNYSGSFVIDSIDNLDEYKDYIDTFMDVYVKGLSPFNGKENGINRMNAPVVAKRDAYLLGCRSDVFSEMLLWDEENVIFVQYWYESKGFLLDIFTFPELFYKETIDLNKILNNTKTEEDLSVGFKDVLSVMDEAWESAKKN